MSPTASVVEFWRRWIDDVAAGLSRIESSLKRRRRVELAEQADGMFRIVERGSDPLGGAVLRFDDGRVVGPDQEQLKALFKGGQVEVALSPERFLFRTIELPRGANPFLEGVVRSQIDRLTPWGANDAAFGWRQGEDGESARISVTVAASPRANVEPFADALIAGGVDAVRLSTLEAGGPAPIAVLAKRSDRESETASRRNVVVALGVSGLAFVASLAVWLVVSRIDDARETALSDAIAQRRAALLHGKGSLGGQAAEALAARKRASPSAVLAIEALSKALPDDAHLTELRMEDRKIEIVGVASDAPGLIRLIEQSPSFAHATFFAPTVRAPNGASAFHIEAQVAPPSAARDGR